MRYNNLISFAVILSTRKSDEYLLSLLISLSYRRWRLYSDWYALNVARFMPDLCCTCSLFALYTKSFSTFHYITNRGNYNKMRQPTNTCILRQLSTRAGYFRLWVQYSELNMFARKLNIYKEKARSAHYELPPNLSHSNRPWRWNLPAVPAGGSATNGDESVVQITRGPPLQARIDSGWVE